MTHGHCKPLPDIDGSVWPSVASYFYCSLEQISLKSRDDMIVPLLKAGYTRRQAIILYDTYWTRYRNRRIEWMRKEGVVV